MKQKKIGKKVIFINKFYRTDERPDSCFFLNAANIAFLQVNTDITRYHDTDIIKYTVDYINTPEFKKKLKDAISLQLKRSGSKEDLAYLKSELDDMSVLFSETTCFIPESYYYKVIPNTYESYDTFSTGINYIVAGSEKCLKFFTIESVVLNNNMLQMEVFRGKKFDNMRVGDLFRFQFSYSYYTFNEFFFLSFDRIIVN